MNDIAQLCVGVFLAGLELYLTRLCTAFKRKLAVALKNWRNSILPLGSAQRISTAQLVFAKMSSC